MDILQKPFFRFSKCVLPTMVLAVVCASVGAPKLFKHSTTANSFAQAIKEGWPKFGQERGLTSNEIQLASEVFGDQVDYKKVRIAAYDSSLLDHAVTTGNTIFLSGLNVPSDCTLNDDGSTQFMHEMTHVWQYQKKGKNLVLNALMLDIKFKGDYHLSYNNDGNIEFKKSNIEQQGALVEDYQDTKNNLRDYRKYQAKGGNTWILGEDIIQSAISESNQLKDASLPLKEIDLRFLDITPQKTPQNAPKTLNQKISFKK